MADGRHIEKKYKSLYLRNHLTDFHNIQMCDIIMTCRTAAYIQGCAIRGSCWYYSLFRGQMPKKTIFGGEWPFSSLMLKILKLAYYPNYCTDSNPILHCDRDHQNTLRGWAKQAYNKSKMADGDHFKKLRKRPYLGPTTAWPMNATYGTVIHIYCENRISR